MNKRTLTLAIAIAALLIALAIYALLTAAPKQETPSPTLQPTPTPSLRATVKPTIKPSVKPASRFSTPEECLENDFCSPECLCALETKYCKSSHSLGCASGDFMQCACYNAERSRKQFNYNDSKAAWLQNYAVYYGGRWVNIPIKRQCFNGNEVYNVIIFSATFYKFVDRKKPC